MSGPALYLAILLYSLPGIVIGVVAHGLTHAAVALRLGDPSPRREGEISIDPRRHADPFGTIALLLAGFGWSQPARLDPALLREPIRRALVALAGPLGHLFVAVIFALALRVEVLAAGLDPASLDIVAGLTGAKVLYGLLLQGFLINLALFVFNLLPLPGLDGYAALRSVLFTRLPRVFQWLEQQRLLVYTLVALLIFVLPEVTAGAINPFTAATTSFASTVFAHLVVPGATPIFLGLPNVFTVFSA